MAMKRHLFDDDEDRVRLGRFSDHDEQQAEKLFKSNFHLHPTKSPYRGMHVYQHVRQAITYRARTISTGWGNEGHPEAVVKFSSSHKSRKTVIASIRYIARLEETDETNEPPAPVRDEFGLPLDADAVIQRITDWDLRPDKDNLSKEARDLIAEGKTEEAQKLNDSKRLCNIQARHIILSIKSGDDREKETEILERAVFATLDKFFSSDGFRYIWAVHQDCIEHLHAHVIIKSQPRFGKRLWIDRYGDFKHALRTDFAFNLGEAGLPHQATCREDRWKTRERIMEGIEPLRLNDTLAKLKGKSKGRSDTLSPSSPAPPPLLNFFPKIRLLSRKPKRPPKLTRAQIKVMADRDTVVRRLQRIADLDEYMSGNSKNAERIHQIIKNDQQISVTQIPGPRRVKPQAADISVKTTRAEGQNSKERKTHVIYCDEQGLPVSKQVKPTHTPKSRGQEM